MPPIRLQDGEVDLDRHEVRRGSVVTPLTANPRQRPPAVYCSSLYCAPARSFFGLGSAGSPSTAGIGSTNGRLRPYARPPPVTHATCSPGDPSGPGLPSRSTRNPL
jgi:hypothetical protein